VPQKRLLLLLGRIASLAKMQPTTTDVTHSAVCLSLCVSVCWALGWALQKRLNRSSCRLEGWLKWVQETIY